MFPILPTATDACAGTAPWPSHNERASMLSHKQVSSGGVFLWRPAKVPPAQYGAPAGSLAFSIVSGAFLQAKQRPNSHVKETITQ